MVMGLLDVDKKRLKKMLRRRKTWTKSDEKKLQEMKTKFGKRRYLHLRLFFSDDNLRLQGHPEGRRYLSIRLREKMKGKLKKVM